MFLVIDGQRFNTNHITTMLPHPLNDGAVNVRFVNGETLTVTSDEADWIERASYGPRETYTQPPEYSTYTPNWRTF